jgi:uncharacterized protein (UPF0216 family)
MTEGPHAEARLTAALRRVNGGIVQERKTLARLLVERVPSTICYDRSEYRFDPFVLRTFATSLDPSFSKRLLLPFIFFADIDDGHRCFIVSADTFTALRTLHAIRGPRQLIGNRLYLDRSVAEEFLARFPGLGQIAIASPLADGRAPPSRAPAVEAPVSPAPFVADEWKRQDPLVRR